MKLEAALLKAHEEGDGEALAKLYADAATQSDGEQAAFYLTHAYVFALEEGLDEAETYRAQLKNWGREE